MTLGKPVSASATLLMIRSCSLILLNLLMKENKYMILTIYFSSARHFNSN